MNKEKFYIQVWFICLMFAFSPLVFPLIIGLVLLALRIKEDKKRQRLLSDLQEKVEQLSKYSGIIDIETTTNEIIDNAKKISLSAIATRQSAEHERKDILSAAKNEASGIITDAKKQAKEINAEAERRRQISIDSHDEIISNANKKAEQIAGNAYEAMKNADNLRDIANAMKSIIEGYGFDYITPSFTLFDRLADEYGFTEAGERLKDARSHTRLLVKDMRAAKCDYAEGIRNKTAVNFVTDAFNGKVDTILADAKHDNYGVLNQKIKDAYLLVNHLGTPFKNARITEEYLDARLNELKWIVLLNEIRLKEKEEQRAIREQIREEEKARKEYERAIKEAAKEEELLKKAMEKVKKQIEDASSEQREKYEAQLQEMKEKLKLAEEKNQRAMSMAQQTKVGNVYIISNIGSFGENVFKVGVTRRLDPLDRVRELSGASVPFSFEVHAIIYSTDAPALETELHKKLSEYRVNKVNLRKEFFEIPLTDIRKHIESMDIKTRWTMIAEATEYRESLALKNGAELSHIV